MIEQDLLNYLLDSPVVYHEVDDRIYPVKAPQSSIMPRIVLTSVSGTRGYDTLGPDGYKTANIQLQIHSKKYFEGKALAEILENLLSGLQEQWPNHWVQGIFLETPSEAFEVPTDASEDGIYLTTLEFTIHYS